MSESSKSQTDETEPQAIWKSGIHILEVLVAEDEPGQYVARKLLDGKFLEHENLSAGSPSQACQETALQFGLAIERVDEDDIVGRSKAQEQEIVVIRHENNYYETMLMVNGEMESNQELYATTDEEAPEEARILFGWA